ncbi:hypothetical protein [Streptomyces sp. SD15]
MQGEVVVALISTLGTVLAGVLVAMLSPGRAGNDCSRHLMSMSVYCGRIRGTAAAALKDCAQAVDHMQGGASYHGRTADQRDGLFVEAQFGEELGDELRPDLHWFNKKISQFLRELRRAGEKIDGMARSASGDGETRTRELADVRTSLRVAEGYLNEADAEFALLRGNYLEKQASGLSGRAQRRLHKRAKKRYDVNARSGERAVTGHLHEVAAGPPRSDDGVRRAGQAPVQGDGARAAGQTGAEPPPCGYCVWRCPHAPAGTGVLGG